MVIVRTHLCIRHQQEAWRKSLYQNDDYDVVFQAKRLCVKRALGSRPKSIDFRLAFDHIWPSLSERDA